MFNLKRAEGHAHLTLRWRGGAITMLDVEVPRFRPMGPRTDEDTISLLRRLAALYPDEVIAGILNRQERKTATGERFTANQVGSLRLPQHPSLPTSRSTACGRSGHYSESGSDPRAEYFYHSSLVGRWLHRWRTGHSRCTLANSNHRRVARAHRRRGATRLSSDVGNNNKTRRFAPNCVAACKAWRTPSHAGNARAPQRLAYQSDRSTVNAFQRTFMNQGAL